MEGGERERKKERKRERARAREGERESARARERERARAALEPPLKSANRHICFCILLHMCAHRLGGSGMR